MPISIETLSNMKVCPRPTSLELRENLENLPNERKQMTAMVTPLADASSATQLNWNTIDWQKAVVEVRRLQMRIAKVYRERRYRKVKALQWILTHSLSAKLLAVKRVAENKGARTPGVDNVVWRTPTQKMQAALSLKRQGYQTKPLKRIRIPKKQPGKFRFLHIPTMQCRAQQALHLLSLEPIAETVADKNAYGFRPLRAAADAIDQCFIALSRKRSPQYILEADIQSCFDSLSNQWMMDNIPMDKKMLGKWLTAGYIEKGKCYPTHKGTPQGAPISPALLVVALSGLEKAVKTATCRQDKINVCIYADDFIITGATPEVLETKVKPAVTAFLSERGLSLAQDKTRITRIRKGIDFLGFNLRKYENGKLIIKPAKSSVKRFLAEVRRTIKRNATAKMEDLINQLNSKITGFSNYYRHVCAKTTFQYVDHNIFKAIWGWAVRRHQNPRKGKQWVKLKYFRADKHRNWIFSVSIKNQNQETTYVDLKEASKTIIKRHVKIRADATPYDSNYHDYFDKRITTRCQENNPQRQPEWWLCWWNLLNPKQKAKDRVTCDGFIKA